MPQSPKHVTVSATRVNETRRCIMLLHDLRKQATEVKTEVKEDATVS
jgi:hypothetical protein